MTVDPSTTAFRGNVPFAVLGVFIFSTGPIHTDVRLHDVSTHQTNEATGISIWISKENIIYEINVGKIFLTRAEYFVFKLELGTVQLA